MTVGIIILLLSLACYGLVMWIQITRIDRLEQHIHIADERHRFVVNWLRDLSQATNSPTPTPDPDAVRKESIFYMDAG